MNLFVAIDGNRINLLIVIRILLRNKIIIILRYAIDALCTVITHDLRLSICLLQLFIISRNVKL